MSKECAVPARFSSTTINPGLLNTVITRLTPRIIAILILTAIFTFAGVLAFAIHKGKMVEFWGLKISGGNVQAGPAGKTANMKKAADVCISPQDLSLVSETVFVQGQSKDELIARIKELLASSDELEENEAHYAYRLFQIEKSIPKYGTSIDTAIRDGSRVDVYKKIQEALQGIKVYNGPINGDQQSTYEAVVKFQSAYNRQAGKEIFDPKTFGIFGHGTLEAIRSTYRFTKN